MDVKLKKSEKTRKKILEVAMKLFATQGVDKTTTRKIAQKARISTGLVNHYFPKSEVIFLEAVRYVFEDFKTKTRSEAREHVGAEKIIQALKKNYELFLGNPFHYRCFATSYAYGAINKKFKDLHTYIFNSFTGTIGKYAEEYLKLNGVVRTKDDIHDLAVGILEELDGSLLFFFFTDHKLSAKVYTEIRLTRLRKKLEHFLSEAKPSQNRRP